MARTRVQFLVLAAFLIVALCSAYDGVQIIERNDNVLMQQDIDAQTTKDDFLYHVTNKRGIPCILANMAMKFTGSYQKGDAPSSGSLGIPDGTKSTGSCSDAKSEMTFTWKVVKNDKIENNNVTFTFINDYTDFSLYSITAHIYLDDTNFPGITDPNRVRNLFSGNDLRLFVAPVKTGLHKCEKEVIKMNDFEFDISNISVIAFNKVHDFSMRKEEKCSEPTNKVDTFPYSLKNEENETCILAKMDISVTIPYSTKDSVTKNGTKSISGEKTISGSCGSALSDMTITWSESTNEPSTFATENTNNSVTIQFAKSSGYTYVTDISFDIYADSKNFPGSVSTRLRDRTPSKIRELIAPQNGLYSCAKKAISLEKGVMNVSNLLLVAFDTGSDFSKKTAVDCKSEFSPKEKDFQYIVKNSDGVACVLANMNIVIDVQYEQTSKQNNTIPIPVPSTLTVTGDCEYAASKMRLTWSTGSVTRAIVFYIRRNSTSNFFFVYQIQSEISLNKEIFPDAVSQDKILLGLSGDSEYLFAANATNGMYNCTEEKHVVPMSNGMKVTITNVAFIAFNEDDDLTTRQSQSCSKEPDTTTTSTTVTIPTEPPTEPTTLPPEPDPSVKRSAYYVMKSGSDVACIVANMTISLRISYDKTVSGTNVKTLTVPKSSKVGGTCDDATSTMELIWQEKTDATFDTTDTSNVVTLAFKKTGLKFSLHSINVSWYMDEKNFQDAKRVKQRAVAFAKDANVFTSSVGKLYKCAPKATKKVETVDVTIGDMSLIAFNTEKTISARAEENCVTEEEGSDVGAIVGGIIGGLILAGLLGYGVVWYLKRRRAT